MSSWAPAAPSCQVHGRRGFRAPASMAARARPVRHPRAPIGRRTARPLTDGRAERCPLQLGQSRRAVRETWRGSFFSPVPMDPWRRCPIQLWPSTVASPVGGSVLDALLRRGWLC